MNRAMKKAARAIVTALSVLLMGNNLRIRNETFTDYEANPLENENLECFVEALDELGKDSKVMDYSSHVARILTVNGYGKQQVYFF